MKFIQVRLINICNNNYNIKTQMIGKIHSSDITQKILALKKLSILRKNTHIIDT